MTCRGGVFSLLACLLLGACATENAVGPSEGGGTPDALADQAEITRRLLPNTDNGLELRRWRLADSLLEGEDGQMQVVDRAPVIAAALMKYADGQAMDEEAEGRLQQNGFRLVRVKTDHVEDLQADLGGVTVDVTGWHGQAYDWREVATHSVGHEGCAIAVSGRVRRFADGRLRLMIRGWTMQMEDGPYLHLEVMPDYCRSNPTRLDQALGRRRFQGERFPAMALDLLTEAGYAYVLVCESPGVEWTAAETGGEEEAEVLAAGEEAVDEGDGETSIAARRDLFAAPGVGPEAAMPLTVGELLLREEAVPPVREVLLFVPRIPDALFPPPTSGVGVEDES